MLKWLFGLLLLALEPILDFIREHINSWFWGAILTIALLYVRIKEKKERKDSSRRIEAKLDAIASHLGVEGEWNGNSKISYNTVQTNSKKWWGWLSKAILPVNLLRRVKIMSKFKSRKFILAVVSAVLIVLNDGLDLGIDSDTVLAFAGIVAVWITGESVVDARRAGGASNESQKHSGDSGAAV